MAGDPRFHPALASLAPWCWRVLTPSVVGVLPFPNLTGFRIVSVGSTAAGLIVFYALLIRVGASRPAAALGLAPYAGIFWAVKFSFYSPASVDAATQLFLLLILLLLAEDRYGLTVPVLMLGILQKESVAVLGLVAAVRWVARRQRLSKDARAHPLVALALPLATHLAVRAWKPPVNSSLRLAWSGMAALTRPAIWPRLVLELYSGLGVLPLVLLGRWRDAIRVMPRDPAWVTLLVVGSGLLFGGMDKGRLFLPMLPAVVMWALAVVAAIRKRAAESASRWWLAATLGAVGTADGSVAPAASPSHAGPGAVRARGRILARYPPGGSVDRLGRPPDRRRAGIPRDSVPHGVL